MDTDYIATTLVEIDALNRQIAAQQNALRDALNVPAAGIRDAVMASTHAMQCRVAWVLGEKRCLCEEAK